MLTTARPPSPLRPTRVKAALALLLLAAATPLAGAAADGAHFWISTTGSGSSGPEAPTLPMTVGETKTIYLWGRPRAGRQLLSVSLNLVSDAPAVDFVDGTYAINNTITGGVSRFEFTRESSTAPTLTSEFDMTEVSLGDADELLGINAFNLFGEPPNYLGMGPTCSASELDCEIASDGEPAWLFATLDIRAVTANPNVSVSLQIGDRGLVEQTLAPGDYDFDEIVGASDRTVWTSGFGSTTALAADGNGNGVIDAADYTIYRDHLGATATLGAVSDSDARLGLATDPLHNAATDKETNLGGDSADLILAISSPSVSVPEPTAAALALLSAVSLAVGARISLRHPQGVPTPPASREVRRDGPGAEPSPTAKTRRREESYSGKSSGEEAVPMVRSKNSSYLRIRLSIFTSPFSPWPPVGSRNNSTCVSLPARKSSR